MNRFCISILLSILFVFVQAQVPVSKEPRHHLVFSNEKVRVLHVLLPVGDTTLYHLHSTPSVFVMLSSTKTGSQLMGQSPSYSKSTAGSINFENLNPPHTRTHRVWNMDSTPFRVIDVELLSGKPVSGQPPLVIPHLQLMEDTSWVNTYTIALQQSEKISIAEKDRSLLLIRLNNAPVNIFRDKQRLATMTGEGDFVWLNPGDAISLDNQQAGIARFALLEIK